MQVLHLTSITLFETIIRFSALYFWMTVLFVTVLYLRGKLRISFEPDLVELSIDDYGSQLYTIYVDHTEEDDVVDYLADHGVTINLLMPEHDE